MGGATPHPVTGSGVCSTITVSRSRSLVSSRSLYLSAAASCKYAAVYFMLTNCALY